MQLFSDVIAVRQSLQISHQRLVIALNERLTGGRLASTKPKHQRLIRFTRRFGALLVARLRFIVCVSAVINTTLLNGCYCGFRILKLIHRAIT